MCTAAHDYDLTPEYAGTASDAGDDGKHQKLLDPVVAPFFRRDAFVGGQMTSAHGGVAINYRLFPQPGEATGSDRGAVVFLT